MTELLRDYDVTCQSCWETFTVTLDLSIDDQEIVEDCQVCCCPMAIRVSADDGRLVSVDVAAA